MAKILTAIFQVTVRRDANTITPTSVAKHEIPMLSKTFGKENVTVGPQVAEREIDTEGEYERLMAKYGEEPVKSLYGDDEGLRLGEMVEKNAISDPATKAGKK